MNILDPDFNTLFLFIYFFYLFLMMWPLGRHKSMINIHELFENCLERRSKLLKFKSLYLREYLEFLHAIFHYSSWHNAFTIVMNRNIDLCHLNLKAIWN